MGFSSREVARKNNWTKDKAQRRVVKELKFISGDQ